MFLISFYILQLANFSVVVLSRHRPFDPNTRFEFILKVCSQTLLPVLPILTLVLITLYLLNSIFYEGNSV